MRKVLGRKIIKSKPLIKPRKINLPEFYEKRNKILIIRAVGGLGDIFMHRMMFEDFKKVMPDAEIHFACPPQYHEAVDDHPYVDKVLDSGTVDRTEYIVSYVTTTACGRHELRIAPYADLNRSDIWAHHCGLELTNHNMHLNITQKQKDFGIKVIEEKRYMNGPKVALCPISAMAGKNLLKEHIEGVVKYLIKRGCYVYGVHLSPIEELTKLNVPTIHKTSLKEWMGVIDQSDYVISVDTAAFHLAGGLGKPLTGIFTWANAETYGKWYPTANFVQGPCPAGYKGCYNWGLCPIQKYGYIKPCLTDMKIDQIINACEKMFKT